MRLSETSEPVVPASPSASEPKGAQMSQKNQHKKQPQITWLQCPEAKQGKVANSRVWWEKQALAQTRNLPYLRFLRDVSEANGMFFAVE